MILTPLEQLRPTQMAVGMRAVTMQRRKVETRTRGDKNIEEVLAGRPIPMVRGPGGENFIIDRHHFALALWQAQIGFAFTVLVDDLTQLPPLAFWRQMEAAGWLYPFDEFGERTPVKRLPRRLESLRHDPYRDLAWDVREAGGYLKTAKPFAEFHWAAFFRKRITPALLHRDHDLALSRALKLCATPAAAALPGALAAQTKS